MSMAAALRQAAARLGGSARAVAEVQPRRLISSPRLIHTQRHAKHPEKECEEYARRQVQQKKEELYDALFDAREYGNTWRDTGLLKNLSLHVQPRPNDHHWLRMSRNKQMSSIFLMSGWVVLVGLILCNPEKTSCGDVHWPSCSSCGVTYKHCGYCRAIFSPLSDSANSEGENSEVSQDMQEE